MRDAVEQAPIESQARRLALGAALTRRAARTLGAERLPPAAAADELVELAERLGEANGSDARAHAVRFAPPYPGVTGGVEALGGGVRLVLACVALERGGAPLGTVFTSLIAGRAPLVAVAPPGAPMPDGWSTLPGSP